MIPRTYNGYAIDEANALLVNRDGAQKKLRNKAFQVLLVLARSESLLVTKKQIIQQVWPDSVVTDDSLVQCISEIRKALDVSTREVLITRSRLGYELHPDAEPDKRLLASATSAMFPKTAESEDAKVRNYNVINSKVRSSKTASSETASSETRKPESGSTNLRRSDSDLAGDSHAGQPGIDRSSRAPTGPINGLRLVNNQVQGDSALSATKQQRLADNSQLVGRRNLQSIGRNAEVDDVLQWLHAKFESVERGMLVVTGDAGVGKTHLLDEIRAHNTIADNYQVCSSLCFEVGCDLAFSTLANWLRTPQIADNIWLLSAEQQSVICKLLPEINSADPNVPSVDPGLERYHLLRLYEAVLAAFQLSAKPLLFVIDNLQWCDRESLAWIEYLTCRKNSPAHVLLCASRTIDCKTGKMALDVMQLYRAHSGCKDIRLEPLSGDDSKKLLRCLVPAEVDSQTLAAAASVAKGMPLHLCEIARCTMLSDGELNLSQGVRHFVGLRLNLLNASDRALLDICAVLGSSFTVELLVNILQETEDRILEILEHLWALAFVDVVDTGTYAIHDVVRDYIYEQLAPVARSRNHLQIAAHLESEVMSGNPEAWIPQARHYESAGMIKKAAGCYQQAAKYLRQSFASGAEACELQRALACLEKLPRNPSLDKTRVEVLLDLGLALSRDSGWGAAAVGAAWKDACFLAKTLEDKTLKARAINTYDTYLRDNGQWHRCAEVGADAYAMSSRISDPYLRQSLISSRAAMLLHHGKPAEALSLYDNILSDTRSVKTRASYNWFNTSHRIGAFFRSAQCLWLTGNTAEGEDRCRQALALSEGSENPFHQAITLFHVCLFYEFDQNYKQVVEYARDLLDISSRYSFNYYTGSANLYLAFAELNGTQDNTRAQALADEVQQITEAQHESGTRMFDAYWFANLARARLLTGDADAGYQIAMHALSKSRVTKNNFWDSELHRICGDALRLSGESEVHAKEKSTDHAPDCSTDNKERCRRHDQQAVSIARQQGAANLLRRLQAVSSSVVDAPERVPHASVSRHAAGY